MHALVHEGLASAGEADVLVVFGDFPDLSGAAELSTKEEKAHYVFDALRQNARRHAPLLAELSRRGIAAEPLWIANAVHVPHADAATVAMAQRTAGVDRVAPVQQWRIDELERRAQTLPAHKRSARGAVPTWGVRDIGADRVWDLGVRGEGAVVAGGDTGYDWTHAALRPQYRGTLAAGGALDSVRHDYHWYDGVREAFPGTNDENPCGFGVEAPCDDGRHGTHTMGTIVGYDGPEHQIGVAPEAAWMACRNMDRGNGTPTSYLNCFQFFLAPTDLRGENPRPEMAPDVIANSWYCPESEGCLPETYAAFDDAVAALRAAGVVVVVSAGNAGPGCNTINEIPARVPGAFAVGAHDSLGRIASFSSRGSAADGDTVRPDLTMPGVSVESSVPGDRYASFNGTSMAGPHAAGVVALMISANPALRGRVDTIESMLRRSARPTAAPDDGCGAPDGPEAGVPNYTFGYGRGFALRAVELARAYEAPDVSAVAAAAALRFGVSPNPARGYAEVALPEGLTGAELRVTDVTGRTLALRRVGGERERLTTDGWPAGVYVVTVTSERGRVSEPLVVE